MAEETTEIAQEHLATSTPDVPEGKGSPEQAALASEEPAPPTDAAPAETTANPVPDTPPDAVQPFIDKAFETIQHEVEASELGKFLRAHIKTFREEWDTWSDTAKDVYVHMMTSQLLQRKAARTRIMNHEKFKLPVPSAQTTLFESIQQAQTKPKKCIPVLLIPPNLRPTYALKK